jgi:hypothetical protein
VNSKNTPLVVAVAAVGVLAVVAGGAVAARQRPSEDDTGANPLPVASSTPPSPLASSTPGTSPVPTRTPLVAGTELKIALSKLPKGRAPQIPYLQGRVVRGGAGADMTIPGKQNILQVVRSGGSLLVVLEVGVGGGELARFNDDGTADAKRVPDVLNVVSSPDDEFAAFATAPTNPDHTRKKGSAVYWQNARTERRTLKRPDDWGSKVLAVFGDTVYFKSDTDQNGETSTLNSWNSATGEVTLIKSVRSPLGVSSDGSTAVDFVAGASQTFCSALVDLDSGNKQLWRSCEYSIDGFTPDGSVAIATPDFKGTGSDPWVAALNVKDAELRRKWSGADFLQEVGEDNDNVLMVADTGEGTKSAIVRCTISTGACELATPLAKSARFDVRLLGAWQ